MYGASSSVIREAIREGVQEPSSLASGCVVCPHREELSGTKTAEATVINKVTHEGRQGQT
jgi:hypothetical protein